MDNQRKAYLNSSKYMDLSKIKPKSLLKMITLAKEDLLSQIKSITDNKETPTFKNTLIPYEAAGQDYEFLLNVLSNFRSSDNSPLITKIFKKVNSYSSQIDKKVLFNPLLFSKIKTVYENELSTLTGEDLVLIKSVYKYFTKDGANLPKERQKELSKINEKLGNTGLKFSNNLQKDQDLQSIHILNKEELNGLSEEFVNDFKKLAIKKKKQGYVIPADDATISEVLEKCSFQETRKKAFYLSGNLGDNKNAYNNQSVIKELLSLSQAKANILGFSSAAELILEERICNSPKKVRNFLTPLLKRANPKAKEVVKKYAKYAKQLGIKEFKSYDLDYVDYQKEKKKKSIIIKEFFPLKSVMTGLNSFLSTTFKIKLVKTNYKSFHKEVSVYKVIDSGKLLGYIHFDLYQRKNKDSGAWMLPIVSPTKDCPPQVLIALNLRKSKNILLDLEEVKTVYHEMGHALHALCSKTKYRMMGGINVSWDFVELPSQLMENFLTNKDFVKSWARHYKTGRPLNSKEIKALDLKIPFKELVLRSHSLRSLLDLSFYSTNPKEIKSLRDFENKIYKPHALSLTKGIKESLMSTNFSHIFGGGYEAGYYSYLYAEMLDSNAYQAFKNLPFKKWGVVGQKFKEEVLSKGSSRPEMESFKAFKGSEPSVKPLLKRYGV